MNALFMVGVDGSEGSLRAARFAAERAGREGARLLLVHVIEWSPYGPLTPDELAKRHVERQRELDDADVRVLGPVAEALGAIESERVVRHGHVVKTLSELARERGAAQIFTGRRGHSTLGALLFGSVPGGLVQVSPVPVTVVP